MRKLMSNGLLIWLLCFTLLFKVVVPVGFMPDLRALQHGIYKIKICSSFGSQNIFVDQNQNPVDGDHQNTDHKSEKAGPICPFAGLQAAGLPLAFLLLTLPLFWRQVRYITRAEAVQSIGLISAWPRGPPLHLA
jgi:hypothetical protein